MGWPFLMVRFVCDPAPSGNSAWNGPVRRPGPTIGCYRAGALHTYGTPSHRLEATLARVSGSPKLESQFLVTPTVSMMSMGRSQTSEAAGPRQLWFSFQSGVAEQRRSVSVEIGFSTTTTAMALVTGLLLANLTVSPRSVLLLTRNEVDYDLGFCDFFPLPGPMTPRCRSWTTAARIAGSCVETT